MGRSAPRGRAPQLPRAVDIAAIAAASALALALAAPRVACAAPAGTYALIVQEPGDQTDPSIDAQYVVFASHATGDWDVMLYDVDLAVSARPIAAGPGDQDQPDVWRTTVAYRTGAGIFVRNWESGEPLRTPGPQHDPSGCVSTAPVAEPSISSAVAAWECGAAGSRMIVVAPTSGGIPEYAVPGRDLHGASTYGPFVSFVDELDGSVWLHDSTPGSRTTSLVCDGRASGASLSAVGLAPILAVARRTLGPDADVEIWDPTGGVGTAGLARVLVVPGEQRNPHLAGEWVAFEDLSTGHAQVVLWQWRDGIVFVPHPTLSNQTLNDLAVVANAEVRVVYADDGDGTGANRDIALYRLPYVNGAFPDDGNPIVLPWGTPPPGTRPLPASCADLYAGMDVTVLATLALGRDHGAPYAGRASFVATPWGADPDLPVLVCVESERASAGWLTLDDRAIATPADFNPSVQRLELHGVVTSGAGTIAGVIASKPGAAMRVRVVADPGRAGGAGTTTTSGAAPSSVVSRAASGTGCGTGGGADPLAALALLLVTLRRRR